MGVSGKGRGAYFWLTGSPDLQSKRPSDTLSVCLAHCLPHVYMLLCCLVRSRCRTQQPRSTVVQRFSACGNENLHTLGSCKRDHACVWPFHKGPKQSHIVNPRWSKLACRAFSAERHRIVFLGTPEVDNPTFMILGFGNTCKLHYSLYIFKSPAGGRFCAAPAPGRS